MTSARSRRTTASSAGSSASTTTASPALTYFYDHATGESRLLFRPYPHLDPETLAPMTPVTITSRDGLDLHSYLTLPVGIEPKGLPLVLRRPRRPVGARQLGLQPRSSAPRQPRLCGAAGQLPRIDRLRQGIHESRDRRVRGQDARRPHRRRGLGGRAGLRGPRSRRHLRRLLRRLRRAGRRHLHPRRLRRRHRLRRHLEPGELHADASAGRQAAPGQQLASVSSATPTIRSRRPTCWPARRSPGSTRSARRCWSSRAPTTFASYRPSPTISSRRCARAASRSSTWSRTTRATDSSTRTT